MAAARLGVGEARIIGEVRTAGDAEEISPMPVGVGEDADMPVGGTMRPPIGSEHPGIARRPDRRVESQPAHMLGHDKGGHRFEHRDLDRLAEPSVHALQQCGHHRIDHRQPDRLVADQGRDKARIAAVAISSATSPLPPWMMSSKAGRLASGPSCP